jgi:hypothetical protein
VHKELEYDIWTLIQNQNDKIDFRMVYMIYSCAIKQKSQPFASVSFICNKSIKFAKLKHTDYHQMT